jgi:hypothetical protein
MSWNQIHELVSASIGRETRKTDRSSLPRIPLRPSPQSAMTDLDADSQKSQPFVPYKLTHAPHPTPARDACSPWHGATVAPQATVAGRAGVRGYLRVPNTLNFIVFSTLDPYARTVYYQLFLLSHGFHRSTCIVGLTKLAESILMSVRKVQETITYLETRGLVRRLERVYGGPRKGTVYEVFLPDVEAGSESAKSGDWYLPAGGATPAPDADFEVGATLAPRATNKRIKK